MSYRPQVPGECEERISDSVAPEHLRGACGREVRPRYRGTGPTGSSRRHGDSPEPCQYHRRKPQRAEMAPPDEEQCM